MEFAAGANLDLGITQRVKKHVVASKIENYFAFLVILFNFFQNFFAQNPDYFLRKASCLSNVIMQGSAFVEVGHDY